MEAQKNSNALAKAEEKAVAKDRAESLKALLVARKEELAAYAQAALKPDLLVTAVMHEARRVPKLLECSPASVYSAVMEAAQLGVLPNAKVGEAALVPRDVRQNVNGQWKTVGVDCDLMVMIGGLRKLALETGTVRKTHGSVVRDGDDFVWDEMNKRVVRHAFDVLKGRGDILGAYGWVEFADGSRAYEYMDRRQLETAKKKAAKNSPAWSDWPDEMYAKIPERRCIKKHSGYRADSALARAFMLEVHDDGADQEPEIETPRALPQGSTTHRLAAVVGGRNAIPAPASDEHHDEEPPPPDLDISHPDAVPPAEEVSS